MHAPVAVPRAATAAQNIQSAKSSQGVSITLKVRPTGAYAQRPTREEIPSIAVAVKAAVAASARRGSPPSALLVYPAIIRRITNIYISCRSPVSCARKSPSQEARPRKYTRYKYSEDRSRVRFFHPESLYASTLSPSFSHLPPQRAAFTVRDSCCANDGDERRDHRRRGTDKKPMSWPRLSPGPKR